MQERETEPLLPKILLNTVTFSTQIELKRACPFKIISVIPGLMLLILAKFLCNFLLSILFFLMHNLLILLDINFPVSNLFMSVSLGVIYLRTNNKRTFFGTRVQILFLFYWTVFGCGAEVVGVPSCLREHCGHKHRNLFTGYVLASFFSVHLQSYLSDMK